MSQSIKEFAIQAHAKVNHLYDGQSYSVHLKDVVDYAHQFISLVPASQVTNVINGTWLHDTIEDCRLTYNDIKKIAGGEVAEIVYALTNNKGRTREERADATYYDGIRNVPFARFVKMCDRLANTKYSKATGSRMFEVYRNELDHFVQSLFPDFSGRVHYWPMIWELYTISDKNSSIVKQ